MRTASVQVNAGIVLLLHCIIHTGFDLDGAVDAIVCSRIDVQQDCSGTAESLNNVTLFRCFFFLIF